VERCDIRLSRIRRRISSRLLSGLGYGGYLVFLRRNAGDLQALEGAKDFFNQCVQIVLKLLGVFLGEGSIFSWNYFGCDLRRGQLIPPGARLNHDEYNLSSPGINKRSNVWKFYFENIIAFQEPRTDKQKKNPSIHSIIVRRQQSF
jgi:hypothetical protein